MKSFAIGIALVGAGLFMLHGIAPVLMHAYPHHAGWALAGAAAGLGLVVWGGIIAVRAANRDFHKD